MNARIAAMAAAIFLVTGCSPSSSAPTDAVDEARSAIIGGSPDPTRNAVVSLSWDTGTCTGTIIETRDSRRFVLTAAHCCRNAPMDALKLFGDEHAITRLDERILSVFIDRAYDGRTHDFCLVEFQGEPTVVESLPLAAWSDAADDLAVGDLVNFVGYGFDGQTNGHRQHIEIPLSHVEDTFVEYDQTQGGPCSGDSGGPGFVEKGGREIVAVVISRGPEGCAGTGVSGRVSAVARDFIEPVIAGEPQRISCNACTKAAVSKVGACAIARQSCLDDPSCQPLATCYASCVTPTCKHACARRHPDGQMKYDAILTCACSDACADVCTESTQCGDPSGSPELGVMVTGGACALSGAANTPFGFVWLGLLLVCGVRMHFRLQHAPVRES